MTVTVMGFVIDHDDILFIAKFAADPSDHLVGSFGKALVLPSARIFLVSLPALLVLGF